MANVNLLKDIPAGNPEEFVNVVVEIPLHSHIKYEYDAKMGIMKVDRFLYTAFTYPFNYGFIPGTLSGDHDPVDILILCNEAIQPGTLIECRIIGMLETEDEEGVDAKVVGVPNFKVDPTHEHIEHLDNLPDGVKNKIQHFYEMYKTLEPGKWVKVTGWKSCTEAIKFVADGIANFNKNP